MSNSPEPRGPVVPSTLRQKPGRPKASHPTRRREPGHWTHGPMLGHRVNSEGLRGRAIAPSGGASGRVYIGFGRRHCQHCDDERIAWLLNTKVILRDSAQTRARKPAKRDCEPPAATSGNFSIACGAPAGAALRPQSSVVLVGRRAASGDGVKQRPPLRFRQFSTVFAATVARMGWRGVGNDGRESS